MLTLATCIGVLILAVVAAIFSLQTSDLVLPENWGFYFPPFFRSEGFYRSCIINVAFAGISTAAAIGTITYSTFWVLRDPLLAIFANLALGILASLSLEAKNTPPTSCRRKWWMIILLAAGLFCYIFSVSTVLKLTTNKSANATQQVTQSQQ